MEITTFDRRLDESTAVERTRNLSTGRYLRTLLTETFGLGSGPADPDVYVVYYPDYILYTTVVYRRLRARDTHKFLAGVDAISGNIGEVDVELPDTHVRDVDRTAVIDPQITEAEARDEWNGWIFQYMSRKYRAMKLIEYDVDDAELVYTPYWIIDNGSLEESLAVSDLTRRTAKLEEIQVLAEFYADHLSADPPASLLEKPT